MKDLDLFRGWRDSSIDWVLENAHAQTHIANTLVVAEGEPAQSLHIVSHGLYGASVMQGASQRRELGRLSAGSVYGEMAWLGAAVASASVRAIETSESLVLPLAVLDAKLAQDTGFAAEFMGALARLLAQRQRASNAALIRQSEPASAPGAATGGATALEASFATFKEVVARCDKAQRSREGLPEQAPGQLRQAFDRLGVEFASSVRALDAINPGAADALGAKVQAEFLPYLLATETAQRLYSKPRGYAGDFMTIEHIYDGTVGGTGVGELIDTVIMAQASATAVRNRRGVLATRIKAAMQRPGSGGQVMSLACGPARELFDAFATLPRDLWPQATLLDIDSEALQLVGKQVAAQGLEGRTRLVQANLIRLALGREKLDVPPQDLIYSIGLIDYFNDEFVVRLLHWIHDRLAPGGEVVLGNFHPGNPDKPFMDYVLEWKLIHRTEDDMQRLFTASPFGRCTDIVFEDAGVNLFAVGRKS